MDALRLALRGEEQLWKVFWIYGIVCNFAMSLLAHEADMHLWPFLGKLFYIISCLYFIFSAMLSWRCAFNTERRIWGLVVRLLVIGGVVFQAFFLDYVLFIKPAHKSGVQTHQLTIIDKVPVTNQDRYRVYCEQKMADYATENGADPKAYIAKNQAYINQCVQYMRSSQRQ